MLILSIRQFFVASSLIMSFFLPFFSFTTSTLLLLYLHRVDTFFFRLDYCTIIILCLCIMATLMSS